MINVVCGIRSTGRICTDLATALEDQGHQVKIAYGRDIVPQEFLKYAVRIGNDFDVRLHGLYARLFDGCGFGSKKATEKFIKWIKEYDPDIIHLHNLHGYYINIEILFDYLRECGKRIIWTLHDCWPFTGHSAYCDTIECLKWKSGCNNCPLLRTYPKSYIDFSDRNWAKKRSILNKIPNLVIVTPSEWLSSNVKSSFLSSYEIKVINNGIDTSKFHYVNSDFRSKHQIDDKYILLGVATSWDDNKGLSDFIKLSERLDNSYIIVLVGVTEQQQRHLPKSIISLTKTNSIDELISIYSASDLFLNLSYCENYPTVNLEAAACNTPVLTYRTGGSPETVFYNEDFIVDRGNLNELIDHIYKIRNYINFSRKLNYDKRSFDKRTTVMNYIELYEEENI